MWNELMKRRYRNKCCYALFRRSVLQCALNGPSLSAQHTLNQASDSCPTCALPPRVLQQWRQLPRPGCGRAGCAQRQEGPAPQHWPAGLEQHPGSQRTGTAVCRQGASLPLLHRTWGVGGGLAGGGERP